MDKFESKLSLLSDDQLLQVVGGTSSGEEENIVDWVIVSF